MHDDGVRKAPGTVSRLPVKDHRVLDSRVSKGSGEQFKDGHDDGMQRPLGLCFPVAG